jgi:PKD repeat protein
MYPTIQLYVSDGSHPSLAGSYLSACTFYASLFRKSPVGASFTAGLDPLVAEILQQAASLVVLDSLDNWKLRSKDKIAIAQFTAEINGSSVQLLNSSWRSTSFSWDFGDGNQSFLKHPVHTFGLAGNYQVHLQALNECGQDSHSELLQIETVNNLDTENQRPRITWNGSGRYTIVGLEMDVILSMHVFDSAGKKLPSNVIEQHAEETRIDITSYPPGIYFLRYSNAIETDAIKLIHF